MSFLNALSVKFKIFAISCVGVIGFVMILAANYSVNVSNAEKLNQVKDIYFPILEKSNANAVRLDRIVELLQSAVAAGEMDILQQADNTADNIRQEFSAIKDLGPSGQVQVGDVIKAFNDYYTIASDVTKQMVSGTIDFSKVPELIKDMTAKLDAAKKLLNEFNSESRDIFTGNIEQANSDAEAALTTSVTITVITIVVLGIITTVISGAITTNLSGVSTSLKDIAQGEGDLTSRIVSKAQDEVGDLTKWFNLFIEKLHGIISEVVATINPLMSATGELHRLTNETSKMTQEQNRVAALVTDAVSDLFERVNHVAQNASSAAGAAREADNDAQEGQKIVNDTVEAINQLAAEVENAGVSINQLSADTNNVGSILDVIQSIAEQTNLLALNAAIEAARAGEHGRGFAVVADEVRTLASRTQQSTQEIQQVIDRLQKSASEVVEVMTSSQERANYSVELASKTGASLTAITEKVTTISTMNDEIATATEEQKQQSKMIQENVVAIRDNVEQAAQRSTQVEQACESLASVSNKLQNVAGQFKV